MWMASAAAATAIANMPKSSGKSSRARTSEVVNEPIFPAALPSSAQPNPRLALRPMDRSSASASSPAVVTGGTVATGTAADESTASNWLPSTC